MHMRKFVAVMALMCTVGGANAFPADEGSYCSGSFDKPAKLALSEIDSMSLTEDGKPKVVFNAPQKLTLVVGNKTEVFTFHEPNEGGAVLVYAPEVDGPSETDAADLYLAEAKIGEAEVMIFADRVFWPCE